jgi:hypothetical protein
MIGQEVDVRGETAGAKLRGNNDTLSDIQKQQQQPINGAEPRPVVGSTVKTKSRRPLSIRTLLLHSRGQLQTSLHTGASCVLSPIAMALILYLAGLLYSTTQSVNRFLSQESAKDLPSNADDPYY